MQLEQNANVCISEMTKMRDISSCFVFTLAPGVQARVRNDVVGAQVTCVLEKNARLEYIDTVMDGVTNASAFTANLNGEGAEVQVIGLFFGNEEQMFTIDHTVHHRASHTTSSILVRGALTGHARAVYTGRIEILLGAIGCHGRQEEHTLLLSEEAHIDTAPHLEIANNDVVCSHSASTTYIDSIKKFYLESRGLSEQEAIMAVVLAHVAPILFHKTVVSTVQKELEEKVIKKLS